MRLAGHCKRLTWERRQLLLRVPANKATQRLRLRRLAVVSLISTSFRSVSAETPSTSALFELSGRRTLRAARR
jgi:hypothetical protein